jgi:hypothetical protein
MTATPKFGDFVPGTIFMFNDGYCAPSGFCGSILRQVWEVLPAVGPNEKYSLEQLCGPEFWNPLGPLERQMAGRIMVRLVLGGWLPFEIIGCRHSNPKKYQLK